LENKLYINPGMLEKPKTPPRKQSSHQVIDLVTPLAPSRVIQPNKEDSKPPTFFIDLTLPDSDIATPRKPPSPSISVKKEVKSEESERSIRVVDNTLRNGSVFQSLEDARQAIFDLEEAKGYLWI